MDIFLYRSLGSGGVAVEAALSLIGAPYELIEAATFDPSAVESGDRVLAANPLRQAPALILPSGETLLPPLGEVSAKLTAGAWVLSLPAGSSTYWQARHSS